jgi:hypothetical protein
MRTRSDRADRALDAALMMTFPASDPIAVSTPEAPVMPASSESEVDRATDLIAPPTGREVRWTPRHET